MVLISEENFELFIIKCFKNYFLLFVRKKEETFHLSLIHDHTLKIISNEDTLSTCILSDVVKHSTIVF